MISLQSRFYFLSASIDYSAKWVISLEASPMWMNSILSILQLTQWLQPYNTYEGKDKPADI